MNEIIQEAAKILENGGLVAIPTETVYGLAADAENPEAVAKIYAAKKRPTNHPLIVHVADAGCLADWAREIPENAIRLTNAFWPGPLTIVLKRSSRAKDFITGGQDTVALRCPTHPITHELLTAFDNGHSRGLAAPSANSFGKISPSLAQHVRDDLGEKPNGSVDLIIDGGPCNVGIESSILDLTCDPPRLLREGAITASMISRVIGGPVLHGQDNHSPRVPGTLKSHYAPDHPLELVEEENLAGRAQFLARHFETFSLIAPENITKRFAPISAKAFGYKSVEDLQTNLYDWLHQLDKTGADVILVVPPQYSDQSCGVLDRLTRAAVPKNK